MALLDVLFDIAAPFITSATEEAGGLLAESALDAGYGAIENETGSVANSTLSSLSSRGSTDTTWLKQILGGAAGTGLVQAGEYLYGLGKRRRGDDIPYKAISSTPSTPSSIPGESEHSIDTPSYDSASTFPDNIPGTDGKTVVFVNPSTLSLKSNMSENRKFSAPAIIVRHHSKYRPPSGTQPLILSGYRTKEMSSYAGKMEINADFTWNDLDDLKRQLDVSVRNYLSQSQTGYKLTSTNAANNEGVEYLLNETAVLAAIYGFCLNHKKEYILTNNSTNDCFVVCRLVTNKLQTNLSLATCFLDTTFEELQNPAGLLRYNLLNENELSNIVTPVSGEATDLRFDLFKHRYKVRKYYKELGKRVIRLRPGDTCVLPVIDKGPWLLSRIAIDETPSGFLAPGYFRQMVFELRGSDIAFSRTAADAKLSTSPAALGIIEKTTMVLSAYSMMKKRFMTFRNAAVSDNSTTVGVYRMLPTITTSEVRTIDKDDKVQKTNDTTMDQSS